eukprot:CAMPEP_0176466468 /NCGR_PEP_ID=MMETSP0127-20121128/37908_1 /TAXON_ID=938130 /ORGANISM="Platyophrya macrostoma, Strain WH" /LENGTH=1495 /DNA_ID=CAMNT_0017859637 /DNA_START=28 /DNA_END=4515 /DNA_ORIENTATION=+
MKVSIIVSLFALAVIANAYGPNISQLNPLPPVYVKVNEVFNADMSSYFTGYNLSYTTNLSSAAVQQPLTVLAAGKFGPSEFTDTPVFTYQSVPRTGSGDINYSGYFLYLTSDNYLYWANITNQTSVPQMVDGIQVTNSKKASCYGAEQIFGTDYIIVDCALLNITTGVQTDIFYYVSLSQQAVVSNYTNPANANTVFNSDSNTVIRGVKILDMGQGNHFIFRYLGYNAFANTSLSNHSYVEVYKAYDWTAPQPYKIFDSQFLGGGNVLTLVSFKTLGNNLFFLDQDGTVIYLQSTGTGFSNNSAYYSSFSISGDVPTGLSVAVEPYQSTPKVTALVYSGSTIYEIDWTTFSRPSLTTTYKLASDMTLFKADFTNNYVYAYVNSTSVGTLFINFARGSAGFTTLYTSVPVTNLPAVIWWSTDRAYDNVYLWDANISEVHNIHYQKSWLIFNTSTVNDSAVLVTATSTGSDGVTISALTATFTYSVISDTNFSVFSNASGVNLTLEYPSPFTVSLDDVVVGPGINFTVNQGSLLTNYTLLNYDNLEVVLPAAFNATTIYFHKLVPHTSPGAFRWFLQADNYTLYSLICVDALNQTSMEPSLNCSTVVGTANLTAAITRLVNLPTYSALICSDHPDLVLFYDANLKLGGSFSTGDPVINACADLVLIPSGDYIVCSQKLAKRIVLWDPVVPDNETQIVINRTWINENQYPIFAPSSISVSQSRPHSIFVKNDVGVMVINLGALKSVGTIEVSTNIVLPAIYLSPPNFDFIVSGTSVLFFIYQGATALLQEYSIAVDAINPILLKQYSQFFQYNYQAGASSHYSSTNNNRFFTVVTDAANTPNVLAFKAGSRANHNFLTSFNMSWPAASTVLLSGSHSTVVDAEYLLVGSGNAKLSAYVVYEHTTLSSNSYLQNRNSVSEQTTFNLTAYSTLPGASSVAVPFNVLTFNSDPPVSPGKDANNTNALNFIDFTTNKTSFQFNPSDFISGIVTSWSLTPENANDTGKISLQVPVGSSNTAFTSPLEVVDLTITETYTFAQSTNRLIRLDSANLTNILSITDMGTGFAPGALKCEGVLAADSTPFSTSFCRDMTNNSAGYFITVSYLGSVPTTLPPVLTPLTSVACMRNVGNFVLMLENPNGKYQNPGSKFHVYNFTNPAYPTYTGVLTGAFFNATSFQVGRWDLVQLAPNYYRIYFSDGRFGVHTCEWNATTGQFSNPQSLNLLTAPAFVADNIPPTSMFLGISVLNFNQQNNFTSIALTTDTYNSYYAGLQFDATGSLYGVTLFAVYKKTSAAVNLAKITTTTVNQQYQFFAVSSYNPNTNEGFVTVYNGTGADQATQIKSINYPAAATGNIAFSLFNDESDNAYFWVYTPPNTNLSATEQSLNQSTVQSFALAPYYAINVVPNSNISSKYVNLTGSNDQGSITVSFNITYTPGPNPPGPNPPGPTPDDKSSKWWIWLIVGLGILVIGVAVFAFVRYRQKKAEQAAVGEDDINAPLATNYA